MSSSTIQHSNIYNTGTITRGGWMQGRISHAPSVYGGAGGFGTRISQSQSSYFCSSGSLTSYGQTMVIKDGKLTMQNLNDRLASYLETVRSLEAKNRELKLNISEFCVKKIDVSKDLGRYFSSISDLRAEIARGCSNNERILLQIDNNKMAADEFKMRCGRYLRGIASE